MRVGPMIPITPTIFSSALRNGVTMIELPEINRDINQHQELLNRVRRDVQDTWRADLEKSLREEWDQYTAQINKYFNRQGVSPLFLKSFLTATAGMGRMNFRRFLVFSAIGAVLWAGGVTVLGYFLGNIEFVKKNIELILILVIVISLIPVMLEWVKHRRQKA